MHVAVVVFASFSTWGSVYKSLFVSVFFSDDNDAAACAAVAAVVAVATTLCWNDL